MERVDFRPYTRDQLVAIVQSRLKTAMEGLDNANPVMDADAIRLACARVAGISGDARRVLDVCRYVSFLTFPSACPVPLYQAGSLQLAFILEF